jgi:hypothetical protein
MTAALQSSLLLTPAPLCFGRVAMLSSEQDCIFVATELDFPLVVQPAHEGTRSGKAKVNGIDPSIALRNATCTSGSQVMVDASGLDFTQRLSAKSAFCPKARG